MGNGTMAKDVGGPPPQYEIMHSSLVIYYLTSQLSVHEPGFIWPIMPFPRRNAKVVDIWEMPKHVRVVD